MWPDEQRLLVLGRMYERQKKAATGFADRDMSGAQNKHRQKTAEKIASLAGVGQATVRRAAEFTKAVDAIRDMGVLYQLTALLGVKTARGVSPARRLTSPPWGGLCTNQCTLAAYVQACRNGLNQGDNGRGGMIALASEKDGLQAILGLLKGKIPKSGEKGIGEGICVL